jgi:hypothetical protein
MGLIACSCPLVGRAISEIEHPTDGVDVTFLRLEAESCAAPEFSSPRALQGSLQLQNAVGISGDKPEKTARPEAERHRECKASRSPGSLIYRVNDVAACNRASSPLAMSL